MTAEELKILLGTPLALFLIMLFASIGSALKQLVVAKREKPELTLVGYFTKNLPETLIMLGHNVFAFGSLVMTDSLNWASAIGIGYMANDAADVWTKQGRSMAIAPPSDSNQHAGFASPRLLVFLLAIAAAIALSGCATNPDGSRELTETGKVALKEVAGIVVSRHFRESPRAAEHAQEIRTVLAELAELPDVTTVAALRQVVQLRIDERVSDPYDREDYSHLLNILSAVLSDYVGTGQLDAGARVKVRDFLGYVAAAIPVQPAP